ncbi:hypothetical protein [Micromonospora carbonacea]|uniref:hypothetical protein n=1 Tax=Micromonospora carbonacea TaxID=47853 RepID=UPI003D749F67
MDGIALGGPELLIVAVSGAAPDVPCCAPTPPRSTSTSGGPPRRALVDPDGDPRQRR